MSSLHRPRLLRISGPLAFAAAAGMAALGGPVGAAPPPEAVPPRPFEAKVDDPMLAPVPPAPAEIGGWQEARRLVAARSTELQRAEAGLARASGQWRQALSALLPDARASLTASYDLLGDDPIAGSAGDGHTPTSPLGTAVVSLRQALVDVAGWRGVRAADASVRAAEASRDDVERRVTRALAKGLIVVVAAERAAEINRVGLREALERAALSKRTFELGAATELDVVRVEQDVAIARTALIEGDESLRVAREALGVALGAAGEVGVRRGFVLDGLVGDVARGCRALATDEARADLTAARAAVDAADARRAAARAGYLPTVDLTSSLVALTTDPGAARATSWDIAAVLSVPLWEGGLRAGLIEERRAATEEARAAAEDVGRELRREVARARRARRVAAALVATATASRELAARADAMTRRSFQMGRAGSDELVQSAAALRQAELALALRQFEAVDAQLEAFLTEARCTR